MIAATWPRADPLEDRLLRLDPASGDWEDARVGDLPRLLGPGDLLVVNDAATLPASLRGRTRAGEAIELRLAGEAGESLWHAVLFGDGDWRTRTEDRPPPPVAREGDPLAFGPGLTARVVDVSEASPRLVDVRFDQEGAELWSALYRHGRPVQYSYVEAPLALWHVQTAYASRPWAVELPSAGRPLNWTVLSALARRGVKLAALTHAAGLSSTGDPALDALLPLSERYDIPSATAEAVRLARRVVAVGTTVVRALESAADGEGVKAGTGVTSLRIGRTFRPRVVDGILTGIHQPGESHFELLLAFAAESLLRSALAHAEEAGYLAHEFGDSCLIL